jgi:uncharacterized protein YeaO (DUF488 family)
MNIKIKRAYESTAKDDGQRILVDRLWPRGIPKDKAKIEFWPRELAPSTELRRWYGHEPEKWSEFKSRYFAELDDHPELIKELLGYMRRGTVTFVYSSKEQDLNNAVALKEYVETLTRCKTSDSDC